MGLVIFRACLSTFRRDCSACYAHLSPAHLRDALRLNPLDGFDTHEKRKDKNP
ncbi:hypothetical protein PSEUDO8AS_30281 [Pseudomonas sp. 8AS]|nr:hypothetical protein PSEUDO8AS_30281 [Pseudomonas sp. 8AS]